MQNSNADLCHVCSSNNLHLFDKFSDLGRATSDCKPWKRGGQLAICNSCLTLQKITNKEWQGEADYIYKHYDLFHQSPKKNEQPVFNASIGSSKPRSVAILEHVISTVKLNANGKVLDIGCGNGAMLKSIIKLLPELQLHGYDPTESNIKAILANTELNSVCASSTLEAFTDQFDLMTMIHVLEHVKAPMALLKTLAKLVKPNGYFVVVVPDFTQNPFDIIIADHCTHFDQDNLKQLLEACDFKVLDISQNTIAKEILVICQSVPTSTSQAKNNLFVNTDNATAAKKLEKKINFVIDQIEWLEQTKLKAEEVSLKSNLFGIFGTSIAANCIFGEIGKNIDFFVDEDPDRAGLIYHGKPVYLPQDVPKDSNVFIALPSKIATTLSNRLNNKSYHIYVPNETEKDKAFVT